MNTLDVRTSFMAVTPAVDLVVFYSIEPVHWRKPGYSLAASKPAG
jgi:hypothetical protein